MEIEATFNITHQMRSTPTKNPIDQGSDITDHVINDNRVVSLEGIISDTPLIALAPIAGSAVAGVPSDPVAAAIQQFFIGSTIGALLGVSNNRVQDHFKMLEELHNNRLPFRLVTGLKVYDNMIITDINIPRNAVNANSLRFSATLEQLQVVSDEEITDVQVPISILDGGLGEIVKAGASTLINFGRQNLEIVQESIQESIDAELLRLGITT